MIFPGIFYPVDNILPGRFLHILALLPSYSYRYSFLYLLAIPVKNWIKNWKKLSIMASYLKI